VLLNWYEQFPVGDYERHRNAAIFAAKPTATPLSTTPSEPAGSTSPKVSPATTMDAAPPADRVEQHAAMGDVIAQQGSVVQHLG
jgi:hypothetical protein